MTRSQPNCYARLTSMTLLLTLLACTAGWTAPNTLVRDSIPDQYKWDLSPIYPDWEAWDADLATASALVDEFAGYQGSMAQGVDQLVDLLQTRDRTGLLVDQIYLYSGLSYYTDLRDNDAAARYQRYENLQTRFEQASSWLHPELLALPSETLRSWLDQDARLAPYRFEIEDVIRQRDHVLRADQEKLLSYFGSFDDAPSNIYSELVYSDIAYPDYVTTSNDTLTLTEGQIWLQLGTNRDQDERKRMFETFYYTYQKNVNTYASIYNGVLQHDWASAQARNYGSTLEAAVDPDHVPTSVYQNLVTTVRQGTGPLQRYHQVRREALGFDEYYWSDRKIPLTEFDKTYEYDEVVPWVIEAVAPLGEEYQALTRELLEGRWVDVYENEGKYSGAFQDDAYGQHPYILTNFNGTLSEVFTLAHEAGHALHTTYAFENQPYATAYYTIFVAEVASTLNEALLLEYLLEHSDDRLERIALLQQAIDNIAGTFYLQTLFADYEWQAHKLVEQGEPITADVLRGIYGELLSDYYGDAISFDSLYHSYWTRISHFFQSPYYVYKYATSYASSAKIVAGIGSDDRMTSESARRRYLDLLRSGGSDFPMEQLKKAGVDLSTPDALQAVVMQLDNLVTRLEEELSQL